MKKKTVSFLVSGRGSNFTAVAKKILNNEIHALTGTVISDKKNAKALEIASSLNIKTYFVDPGKYKNREEHEKEIVRILTLHNTDLIVTAGYMRLLTPFIIGRFKNSIINIHPALLPAFPGINSQKQALDYGVKITGCTTHFIDQGTDTGPIILQKAVPVNDDDTLTSLSSRILTEEHELLFQSVKLFCEDKIQIEGRRVIFKTQSL